MDWLELTQEATPDSVESVVELFGRYCQGSAAIEEQFEGHGEDDSGASPARVVVRAYLPPSDDQVKTLLLIEQALWHLSQIQPLPHLQITPLENKDWANAWREHFHVSRIGRRFVIRPSWRTYDPLEGDLVITLDPGMAFGTGLHPSTRLCVQALETGIQPGMSVLDMGTGSGILAIAAALLGAGYVLALDVDRVAVKAATENVAANGLRGVIAVKEGSLSQADGLYDIIVVNILAHVIRKMLAQGLADHLSPGGQIIAAGILDTQADEVKQALQTQGLRVVEVLQENDWVMLRAERSGE